MACRVGDDDVADESQGTKAEVKVEVLVGMDAKGGGLTQMMVEVLRGIRVKGE